MTREVQRLEETREKKLWNKNKNTNTKKGRENLLDDDWSARADHDVDEVEVSISDLLYAELSVLRTTFQQSSNHRRRPDVLH